jgi:serine protease inhibitor
MNPVKIPSDMLDGSIRMLLASAIFFEGIWQSPFKVEDTEERAFHPKPGEMILIPTMHRLSYMKAGEDEVLGCRWVKLPFNVSSRRVALAPKYSPGELSKDGGKMPSSYVDALVI